MIVHKVIWKYTEDATVDQKDELEGKLLALAKSSPELENLHMHSAYIAEHDSPEGNNQEFTHILVTKFNTEKDRNLYLEHPRHNDFLAWLGRNPIIEKFLAVDCTEPLTPRRTLAYAEDAIELGDKDMLVFALAELERLNDEVSDNPSAYTIQVNGRLVQTSEEISSKLPASMKGVQSSLGFFQAGGYPAEEKPSASSTTGPAKHD